MKRVLVLVLSTEKDFYGRLAETSRATWDAEEIHGVETIFYFGRSAKESTHKFLYTDVDDDFFSMGRKTLAAFDYALQHREFDYVFRDAFARLPNQFAFRVKDDSNRENDVQLMKELHAAFNS